MQSRAARNAQNQFSLCRLVLFAAVIVIWSGVLHAQISPGPLARAHNGLSGPANCTQCHAVSTRSATFLCSECHKEIAAEIQNRRGLHFVFSQSNTCVKCHSDHNGENFNMLHWDPTPKGFDHSKTGYVLDGKHASTTCRSCHTAQHISLSSRALLKSKDLTHTWMGLSPACTTCHQDKHDGRFGANCLQCHNTTTWKGAKFDEQTFDHSKTRFPLTGKHLTTACAKCHTPGDDGRPRYQGIKFQHCLDCHLDPHKGQFKQDCDSCHSTSTWLKSSFANRFDHSKTDYPLVGKHLEVSCSDCHKNGDFKAKIPHNACADCHKPDPHEGQFAKRPDGGRCESCHTLQGWSPSTFTTADHAKTGFPLVSPHAKVKCADCHIPAGKQTKFKIKYALCIDCHKDEHEGQFAADPWRNRCEQCHNGGTFKTSTFTIDKHQKSSFPLTGDHLAVACNDCHKPIAPATKAVYHFSHLSCTTCHEDIHHGEFATRMSQLNSAGKPLGCEACHSTKQWNDLSKFDHGTTKFPLAGSHRAVDCIECHKAPALERTLLHVNFSKVPQECAECHQDPHGHQFAAKESDCGSCHNATKWKPSLFDHEKTAFSLKGGHQNVACGACHTLKKEVEGEMVLFYRPTPVACADCHGSNIPKQTENPAKSSVTLPSYQPFPESSFDVAEQVVRMRKSTFISARTTAHHVSLSKKSRSVSCLCCLDTVDSRSCAFSEFPRTAKDIGRPATPGACEYLRQRRTPDLTAW